MSPVTSPVIGSIRPPGSKSLGNRALVLAALSRGTTTLEGILDSIDTRVMISGLGQLGFSLDGTPASGRWQITGAEGRVPAGAADLDLENSGTSIRFLAALAALGHGTYRLDGNARMRQRPIGDLVNALTHHGVAIRCESDSGCPPLMIDARGIPGGEIAVAGTTSSQYLSAPLMAAPCAEGPLTIRITGSLVSRPYIDMTIALMRLFGAVVVEESPGSFAVSPTGYDGIEWRIEPDASAASYFLAAAAVTGGDVTVEGLGLDALQGDIQFARCLERMGCALHESARGVRIVGGQLTGIDVDMNAISDTAQTLAIVAAFSSGATRIRGIAHARHKETDRVAAMATELTRMGVQVDEHEDGLTIHPGPIRPTRIETYDDHRMAMSFAIAGLVAPSIEILDPGCTSKTYPDFFRDLDRLCGVGS